MVFFEKIEKLDEKRDLSWNIPEQKRGAIKIIGGSKGNFRAVVKTTEFITKKYPLERAPMVFPDSLKSVLPPDLPDALYLPSTDSGSFGDAPSLSAALDCPGYNLIIGDLSKNAETGKIFAELLKVPSRETLITRDAVDLLIDSAPEKILMNPNLTFLASLPQLQKLLRAVYYPKMLLLSQSLIQVAETLHKFTLSYPIKLITLHNDQILVAKDGLVRAVPLEKSGFLPFTLWNGELAAKITALNLYNPHNFMDATLSAIFS